MKMDQTKFRALSVPLFFYLTLLKMFTLKSEIYDRQNLTLCIQLSVTSDDLITLRIS
jgi:hypothetical protein